MSASRGRRGKICEIIQSTLGGGFSKPVQYVKICSLYGAGFYYIPGTDICLKVGGWTR
ncbi:MAG: porin, partial [Pseudolabrys sp.]|nr:porin [Pseudolabrys sp.]